MNFTILQEMWDDLSAKEQFIFLENTKFNPRATKRKIESKGDLPDLTDMLVFLGDNFGGIGIKINPNGQKFYVAMLIHGTMVREFTSPELTFSLWASVREKLKVLCGEEVFNKVEANFDEVESKDGGQTPFNYKIE